MNPPYGPVSAPAQSLSLYGKQTVMDQDQFRSAWEQRKDAFRLEYPHLSDEDTLYEIGKEQALLERLEEKTGKTKQEITDWLHIMG